MLGTVRGDAVLPVWTGAFAARDLRRIGQLRRKAEAFGDFRGAEEIDLGVREPAPALGAVPAGVRADAGQMPVDGGRLRDLRGSSGLRISWRVWTRARSICACRCTTGRNFGGPREP